MKDLCSSRTRGLPLRLKYFSFRRYLNAPFPITLITFLHKKRCSRELRRIEGCGHKFHESCCPPNAALLDSLSADRIDARQITVYDLTNSQHRRGFSNAR